MTWNISATGSKEQAIKSVTDNLGPGDAAKDAAQFARAKEFVLASIDAAPDGSDVAISCHGHDDGATAYSSMSLSTKPAQTAG